MNSAMMKHSIMLNSRLSLKALNVVTFCCVAVLGFSIGCCQQHRHASDCHDCHGGRNQVHGQRMKILRSFCALLHAGLFCALPLGTVPLTCNSHL